MIKLSGLQYLKIDVANQFGKDKLEFQTRIDWVDSNLSNLEQLTDRAEEPYLYIKAVMALRGALQGKPIGHLAGMDAVCSGLQIMSALTGCHRGAHATGLVDPDKRMCAYSEVTKIMERILGNSMNYTRKEVKQAVMTVLYGSKQEPKELFGEDTPEFNAFYEAVREVAPGAWELLQELLGSWQSYAEQHRWTMPDGFDLVVKVKETVSKRITIDELKSSFTFEYKTVKGKKKGVSLAANAIHSVDAFILREMIRRCDYNTEQVEKAKDVLITEDIRRELNGKGIRLDEENPIVPFTDRWRKTKVMDTAIFDVLDKESVQYLSEAHLSALVSVAQRMSLYRPFPILPIHDQFSSHVNNLNEVRHWYKEILAELAESHILTDMICQITGKQGTYQKKSENLGEVIRQSNYSLS